MTHGSVGYGSLWRSLLPKKAPFTTDEDSAFRGTRGFASITPALEVSTMQFHFHTFSVLKFLFYFVFNVHVKELGTCVHLQL